MIPKQFPVIDPLTSLGTKGVVLRLYYRHTAFRVLAATSRRLKFVFHKHSWDTRILTSAEVPIVAKFPKQFKVQILAPLVRYVFLFRPHHRTTPAPCDAETNPAFVFNPPQEFDHAAAEPFCRTPKRVFIGSPFPTHVRNRGHQLERYWIVQVCLPQGQARLPEYQEGYNPVNCAPDIDPASQRRGTRLLPQFYGGER